MKHIESLESRRLFDAASSAIFSGNGHFELAIAPDLGANGVSVRVSETLVHVLNSGTANYFDSVSFRIDGITEAGTDVFPNAGILLANVGTSLDATKGFVQEQFLLGNFTSQFSAEQVTQIASGNAKLIVDVSMFSDNPISVDTSRFEVTVQTVGGNGQAAPASSAPVLVVQPTPTPTITHGKHLGLMKQLLESA